MLIDDISLTIYLQGVHMHFASHSSRQAEEAFLEQKTHLQQCQQQGKRRGEDAELQYFINPFEKNGVTMSAYWEDNLEPSVYQKSRTRGAVMSCLMTVRSRRSWPLYFFERT